MLMVAHSFLAIYAYLNKGWKRFRFSIALFFVTALALCSTIFLPIAVMGWIFRTYAIPYLQEKVNNSMSEFNDKLEEMIDDLVQELDVVPDNVIPDNVVPVD